uniref:QWRF motif-containing protein 3 n=1 Tax=Cajanus cajan TaxID=3821 RepID=A0A151RLN5_CAJCA|nr:hypothetical protein KK1_035127 [Cajanus cajan]
MKTPNASPVSSPSPKPRQHRNREPTSRFLHSPPNSTTHSSECHSPLRRKSSSPAKSHRPTEEPGLTRHQLWPSSATAKRNSGTLADHITQDRIIDHTNGSPRHVATTTAESPFSSSSSSKKPYSIVPGRLSFDENAKPFSSRRNSLESKPDVERKGRARRGTSDSDVANLNGGDFSVLKRFTLRTGSYKSSKSWWALSPGRSESPAMSVESMDKPMSFSSFKHQVTSPTKAKGFLNMGFDLFKGKKSGVTSSPNISFGVYNSEVAHNLRLLDNRFMQWRFANARAHVVSANISHKAQSNLICVWDGLTKLRQSVLKKKIQFVREKLEMKIAFVLYSQMKLLEAWGGLERQHLQAITSIKECLHSVVCRVPLLEGARVNMQSTSIVLRHASDLTASIKSILITFSSSEVDKIAAMLSELAKIVAREKQLLEEFYDLFQTLYVFEVTNFCIIT